MKRSVHIPSFLGALILAPVIWAILGAPLFLVPTVGAAIGAPFYLILGGPAFWLHLRRHAPEPGNLLAVAFWANLLSPVLLVLYLVFTDVPLASMFTGSFLAMFGLSCVHAPVWGLTFGWLYKKFAPEPRVIDAEEVFA